jgi:hypothetical protein
MIEWSTKRYGKQKTVFCVKPKVVDENAVAEIIVAENVEETELNLNISPNVSLNSTIASQKIESITGSLPS